MTGHDGIAETRQGAIAYWQMADEQTVATCK